MMIVYREDFNSLAEDGKASLVFNCIQYVISDVSKDCTSSLRFDKLRKQSYIQHVHSFSERRSSYDE